MRHTLRSGRGVRFPSSPLILTTVGGVHHTPTRSLFSRLADTLSSRVTQAAETVFFQEDRYVTERRRKIEPVPSSPFTLAERLHQQRDVVVRLVPTDVIVDKSKQYIDFIWPADAVEAAERSVRYTAESSASEAAEAGENGSGFTTEKLEAMVPVLTSSDAPRLKEGGIERTEAQHVAKSVEVVPNANGEYRTRALAEYLRAYTPSTDGPLASLSSSSSAPQVLVYGRRGITVTDIIPIGNYALRLCFSDGHNGGIFSYEYLLYLTAPGMKYGLMREYLKQLRDRHKSRDPPKRAPSKRKLETHATDTERAAAVHDVGSKGSDPGEGGHVAPVFRKRASTTAR